MIATDFSPSQREILEEMSLQAEVLDRVSCVLLEKSDNFSAADSQYSSHPLDLSYCAPHSTIHKVAMKHVWFFFLFLVSSTLVLPKAQRTRDVLLFWEECLSDNSSPFCCHADSFSRALKKRYTHKVKAKQPGQSEKGKTACYFTTDTQIPDFFLRGGGFSRTARTFLIEQLENDRKWGKRGGIMRE